MVFLVKRDQFYFWYLIIHIPITILIDSCIIVPEEYQLTISKFLLNFHLTTNKDFLLIELPIWFKVFGIFELLFQLPFFFIGSYFLGKGERSRQIYPFMSLYGFNAFFTTLVCLCYIYTNGSNKGLTYNEIINLILLYIPYLLIPCVMMIDFTIRTTKLLGQHAKLKKN